MTLERNWSGKGKIVEGGYLKFGDTVRVFQIDETDKAVLVVLEQYSKQTFVVHALEDGKRLWSLQGVRVSTSLQM